MAGAFKSYTSEWLTGGAHFVIIVIAVQAEDAAVWPYALAAMSIVSFFAWIASYRRYRQIHDLPTSRVASAAQGYVELFGHSELLPGAPVVSKLSGLPCCWYRYYVERRSGDKWERVDSGISEEYFLLVDDTGQCVVAPEGAEVLTARKETWTQGDYRNTEWLLLPKGVLYAIGEFATNSGNVIEVDERAEVGDLLTDWKKDKARLLARFDLNHDGVIDMQEWERARQEAQREVRLRQQEVRVPDGVNILRKPADGRLFLLANGMPDELGRRFAFWSGLHVCVFLGAGGASLLLL